MKIEVLKPARLDGKDIEKGSIIEIDPELFKSWANLGLAKPYEEPETKAGAVNGVKVNNPPSNGTDNPPGSKKPSSGRRNR